MSQYLPLRLWRHTSGTAVVHIHARNPETGELSGDVNLYREIVTSFKKRGNVVIYITVRESHGRSGTVASARSNLKAELASFNAGSMNFALLRILERYRQFKFDWEEGCNLT